MPLDLESIQDSEHLLDVLIQMEDVLDSLDVYVYKSWIDGEVVAGPAIKRHWASFSLLYPRNKMPDPRAALRLLKHGVRVEFSKVEKAGDDYNPITGENPDAESFWLVKVTFPRRLLDAISAVEIDTYEDEVDGDDVADAEDKGIDDETAYQTDEQAPSDMPMGGDMPPMGDDPMMQGDANAPR